MTRDWRAERESLLLSLEREKKPEVRAEAADLLCELAHDVPPEARAEFAPVMVRMLADAQPLVRSAGLALGSQFLPPDEARALFTRHLTDAATRVRCEAAGRLADLASPEARPALAAALQDEHASVRFEAARGMAALKHPAGLDVLTAALDDNELRFRALAALAELQDPASLPAVRRTFNRWLLPAFERTQAAAVLLKLGDHAGEKHLLARAAKKWTEDRPMALELLGEVRAPAALETLSRVLNDPKDLCRASAARGLGRLGGSTAMTTLAAALASADDDLKVDIAEGLLLIATPEATEIARKIRVSAPEAQADLSAVLAN